MFQSRIRVPKMCGHLIELVRENYDLVAGLELEAMTQISFADPFYAAFRSAPSSGRTTRRPTNKLASTAILKPSKKSRSPSHWWSNQRRVGLFCRPLNGAASHWRLGMKALELMTLFPSRLEATVTLGRGAPEAICKAALT